MPTNRVGIFFPNNMNASEKNRSFEVIDKLLPETSFDISFYQAPEEEILEYIIQTSEKLFSHFHIHLFSSKKDLSGPVLDALDFLESLGSEIISHEFIPNPEGYADRKQFEAFSKSVLKHSDELLVFYNGDSRQISKLLLPFSIAESEGKRPYICKNNLGTAIEMYDRQLL